MRVTCPTLHRFGLGSGVIFDLLASSTHRSDEYAECGGEVGDHDGVVGVYVGVEGVYDGPLGEYEGVVGRAVGELGS